jgi:hypothetical protein
MTIIISRFTQKLLNQMMSKYGILALGCCALGAHKRDLSWFSSSNDGQDKILKISCHEQERTT